MVSPSGSDEAVRDTEAATVESVKSFYRRASFFESAVNLLQWDMQTYMPKAAAHYRARVVSEISMHVFKLVTSDELYHLLTNAQPRDELEEALLRVGLRELEKVRRIPPELYAQFVQEAAMCEHVWETAKKSNDFKLVAPHLERVLDLVRSIAEYIGYERDPYDALLDKFEPGMTAEKLRPIFAELRDFLTSLLEKFEREDDDRDPFCVKIDVNRQRTFSEWLLDHLRFDRSRGRLDVSAHPFTNAIGFGDVRITTRFAEDDVRNSIFSTLHEFGHALYALGVPEDLYGLPTGASASFGFDESQSRFWENIVGRSLAFWKGVHGKFIDLFPEFSHLGPEELWRGVNRVVRSHVRTEADEVTYNLHIVLRFELEHALINGQLGAKDIPSAWNEAFKKYLSLEVPSDALGCLQDPHWYGGAFGYFPSYTLGNLYAAQLKVALERELPLQSLVEAGDFEPVKEWLRSKIHSKGRLREPNELLKDVTGEELNLHHFKDYITTKFSQVYGVSIA